MDSAEDVIAPERARDSSAQLLTLSSLFARKGPYVGTVLAYVVAVVLTLLTLKLAADKFDATTFGEFMVSRRAVTIITYPLLLGLGIGLPRYVAMTSDAGGSPRRSIRYLFAALAIALVVIPAFLLLAFALQDELAHLFFGDASRYALILPTSLVVIGLYLHTVTYGYLMGHLAVVPANLLQIVNTGAIPAVAVLLAGDAATALVILGAATIAASLVAIFIALYIDRRELRTRAIKTPALELLRFGLPRVPGEFALYGLFAIPTFVVAHRFDIETAGYFSFGLSLVQLIGTPFGAVNMVLLPTVSSLVARHSWQRISDFMWRFVLGTAAIAVVGVAVSEFIFASPARSLLGPGLSQAVDASRLLLVASIPYVAYVVVRGALDAISPWPYNSINLVGSVVLVSALLLLTSSYNAAQIAVLIGLVALGASTIYTFNRSIRRARIQSQ